MDHKEKLLEFLIEPENMQFLLEIEPLIPEAKDYKYKVCFDLFMEKFIRPRLWPGYRVDIADTEVTLVEDAGSSAALLHIAVDISQNDRNNWYGVIGSSDLDQHREVQHLHRVLEERVLQSRWKHWLAFTYFARNRSELMHIPLGQPCEDFLEQWAEDFWSFAAEIRTEIESVNTVLRARTS